MDRLRWLKRLWTSTWVPAGVFWPLTQRWSSACTRPNNAVVGHFWPRVSMTLAGAAVLLTLVSMRLIVPAGMRFVFRRRRTSEATTDSAGDIVDTPATEARPPEARAEEPPA